MNPYTSDKALHFPDRLHEYRSGLVPAPVHVHLVISDLCNQNCSFCAYRIDNYTEIFAVQRPDGTLNHNPNRKMDRDDCHELILDLSEIGVKAVQFTGGGEPTVHPYCAEFMAAAQGLGMETALVTNGTRLDGALLEAIMSSAWVRVSIDAGEAATYSKIRETKAGAMDEVLENINTLAATKARRGHDVTIGTGFVVTKDNYREVAIAAKKLKEAGADNMRVSAIFQPDDASYFDGFLEEAQHRVEAAKKYTGDGFEVIDNFPARIGDLQQGRPDYAECGYQYFTTYIGADMNVYRCCVTSYTNHGLVGNIKDHGSFHNLWWSPAHLKDRAIFNAKTCERCQFNDKNRAINGALPMHGKFV